VFYPEANTHALAPKGWGNEETQGRMRKVKDRNLKGTGGGEAEKCYESRPLILNGRKKNGRGGQTRTKGSPSGRLEKKPAASKKEKKG